MTVTRSGPRRDDLHEVAKALEPVLGEAEGAKLAWRAQTMVEVDEGDAAHPVQADRRARR